MVRLTMKKIHIFVFLVFLALISVQCNALTLLSPTEGQVVRENVRIIIPSTDLPTEGFIAIYADDGTGERFLVSMGRESAIKSGNNLIFIWNSKSTYFDPQDPSREKHYRDGNYVLTVKVLNRGGSVVDSAQVKVVLRNKIPRSEPAPAINLAYRFAFGQVNTFDIQSNVQLFEMVNNVGLPILGGLTITGRFKVIQSVEDVRSDGTYMLRLRISSERGQEPSVSISGRKKILYSNVVYKPQLYRLVDKFGKVINENLFTRQKRFKIMDTLPVLPGRPVKEGDSWPVAFNVKIEGLTDVIRLQGMSRLDSFEWQNGIECAKIVSEGLIGSAKLSLAGGKIRSSADTVTAKVVTYFAYKAGRALRQVITIDAPVSIDTDIAGILNSDVFADDSKSGAQTNPLGSILNRYNNALEEAEGGPSTQQSTSANTQNVQTTTQRKQGILRLEAVIRLEK